MADCVRILVVEDDPDISEGTARLLEEAGYSVDGAATGEEALLVVRDHCPDLVLLDRDLPGIDGIEVCRRIKVDPALADVFVVMISGSYVESDAQAEGLESGADGYIARPIANRELLARVEAYVRIHRLTHSVRLHAEESEKTNLATQQAYVASLNLMEDAVSAREHAEQALRSLQESEERHRTILQTAMDGFWLTDMQGRLLEVNEAYCRMSGYSKPELLAMRIADLEAVETAEETDAHNQRIEAEGEDRFESRHHRKDGSVLNLEVSVQYRNVDGGRMVVFLRDITERKREEQALRESEQRIQKKLTTLLSPDDDLGDLALSDIIDVDSIQTMMDDFYEFTRVPVSIIDLEGRVLVGTGWQDICTKFHRVHPDTLRNCIECDTVLTRDVAPGTFKSYLCKNNLWDNCTPLMVGGTHMGNLFTGQFFYEGEKPDDEVFRSQAARHGFDEQDYMAALEQVPVWKRESIQTALTFYTKFAHMLSSLGHGNIGLAKTLERHKEAEEAIRRRHAELEALHTVSGALRTAMNGQEALPILLDETLAALATDSGCIWLYHPGEDELRIATARGWFQPFIHVTLKPGEGVAGAVFASGQTHISNEFAADPLVIEPAVGMFPTGWGAVCAPMRAGETTIGALLVGLPLGHLIGAEQADLLESLAEMGGAALHRMSLHEETERRLGQLQAIHRVDQAISAGTDLLMTLDILLEHAAIQLQVDATDVLLLSPQTLTLEYAAGRGFRTSAAKRARMRLGEGRAGRAALERRTIGANDLARLQDSPRLAPIHAVEGFVAYYVVPLVAKGQVEGVLEVFNRAPLSAGPDWVDLLETLAGQAAIAIENAQLFEHLQRSNLDLALAYDETIEGWSRALDLRDKETEGHTQRVTEMTEHLARVAGIDDAGLANVRRGALLHDMGKMGVPDGILLKPGPLTEEEWVLMREHPQFAYDMLAPITHLRPALDIPYCHHERWDGAGYPRGLKGEQIPLVARLFAVTDVWDALRSDRPYRPGWTEEKALEHICSSAGSHFDPKAVELFLQALEEG